VIYFQQITAQHRKPTPSAALIQRKLKRKDIKSGAETNGNIAVVTIDYPVRQIHAEGCPILASFARGGRRCSVC